MCFWPKTARARLTPMDAACDARKKDAATNAKACFLVAEGLWPSEVSARVRELKRIDEENQRLLKRLQSALLEFNSFQIPAVRSCGKVAYRSGTKAAVNMSKLDQEHKATVQQTCAHVHFC